jgi:kelch-like protein 18
VLASALAALPLAGTVGATLLTTAPSTPWLCSTDEAANCPSSQLTLAPMPTARGRLAALTGSDGKIYTFGGLGAGGGSVDVVEVYDPSAGTWACSTDDGSTCAGGKTLVPMPSIRDGLGAAVGSDGVLYAIGGLKTTPGVSTPALTSAVEAYNPSTNSWACSHGDTAPACSSLSQTILPLPTARTTLAVVADANNGLIYTFGGSYGPSGVDTYTDLVEVYNPMSNTWTCSTGDAGADCASTSLAPMPTARALMGAALGLDGRIYVIGGWDGTKNTPNGLIYDYVEAYDPTSNTWTCSTDDVATICAGGNTLAPMPTARQGLAVIGTNNTLGQIYAIDGSVPTNPPSPNGISVPTVEVYSTKTGGWITVAPTPSKRTRLAGALGGDGRLYAIGGLDPVNNGIFFDYLESLAPITVFIYLPVVYNAHPA